MDPFSLSSLPRDLSLPPEAPPTGSPTAPPPASLQLGGQSAARGAHLAGTGRGGPSGPQALFPPLPCCSLALEAQPQALGLHAHLASGVLPGTRAVSEGQGHRAAVPARGTAHRTSAGVTAGRSSFTEVASGPSASNRAAGPGPGGPGGGHRYGSIHPGACPLKLKSMGSSGALSAALWPDPGHGARVGPGHHAEPAPAPPRAGGASPRCRVFPCLPSAPVPWLLTVSSNAGMPTWVRVGGTAPTWPGCYLG